MGGGQGGLEAHRLRAVRQGFIHLALIDEHLPQVGLGQGQGGVEGASGAEGFEGFVGSAQLAEGRAEVVLGRGEVGPEPEGGAELFDGFGGPAECVDGQAEIVGGFGTVGPEVQGGAATLGRPFMLAQRPVGLREVGVVVRGVGPQGHGLRDQLDGAGVIAGLMVQDAE